MGRCTRAQRDQIRLAGPGIEPAELARGLRGEPDCAVRRRKDIVRPGARQDRKGLHRHFGVSRAACRQYCYRRAKHHAKSDHGEAPTDGGPGVAVYEYALAIAGSATPRRPVPMNSTISAAAIHKRPASMKASK